MTSLVPSAAIMSNVTSIGRICVNDRIRIHDGDRVRDRDRVIDSLDKKHEATLDINAPSA